MISSHLSQELMLMEWLTFQLIHRIGVSLFTHFAPTMIPPVITLQSQGNTRTTAWFSPDRWRTTGGLLLPEINLCPEHLDRDPEAIIVSILHELCHYANHLDGIIDAEGLYHKPSFKNRCQRIDLECSQGEQLFGWAQTRLSNGLREKIRELIPVAAGGLTLVRLDCP